MAKIRSLHAQALRMLDSVPDWQMQFHEWLGLRMAGTLPPDEHDDSKGYDDYEETAAALTPHQWQLLGNALQELGATMDMIQEAYPDEDAE